MSAVGWSDVRIGDVCKVIAGQSPEGSSYNKNGEGLPFYQGKKEFTEKYLGAPTTWTTEVTKEAEAGDILMSVRAPVGPINFSTDKICIGRGLAAIRVGKNIDREYLFYVLLWKQPEISGNEGAVFASINKKQIENIDIPLPSISEQKRIVAILDEAFAGIETAIANTEKNLANARELFQTAVVSRVFGDPDAKSWERSSVEELAVAKKGAIRTGPFGSQLLHSEFCDEGIAVLGIDNAVKNEFSWGKLRFISGKKYRTLKRYTVKPGDVIITIMGTCGRCAIVPNDIPLAINTKHLCCITLDSKRCSPEFLHAYFLYHPVARAYLEKNSKGSIMAGLNMGIIKALPVRLPALDEQSRIVDAIEDTKRETQRLESIYQQKLTALAELKQSLLQKAFSGELTSKALNEPQEAVA